MEGRLNNFQRPKSEKSEKSSGRVPDVNTVWLYGDLQPWLIFPGLLLCKHCENLNSLMQPLVKCLCWKNTLIFFFALCEPYYIAKTLGATGMPNVLFPVSNSQKKDHRKKYQGASVAARVIVWLFLKSSTQTSLSSWRCSDASSVQVLRGLLWGNETYQRLICSRIR